MPGALLCEDYSFSDERIKNGMRKTAIRGLSSLFSKTKSLDKVMRRQVSSSAVTAQLEEKEAKKKERLEYIELKKKQKQEQKDSKVVRQSQLIQKRLRERDVERNVKITRENITKDIRRRREDARAIVESLCDQEMRSASDALVVPEESTAAKDSATMSMALSIRHSSSSSGGGGGVGGGSRRPLPSSGDGGISSAATVPLPGDYLGQFLEIWAFLAAFADPLGLQEIPSVKRLLSVIYSTEPISRKIMQKGVFNGQAYGAASAMADDAKIMLDRLGVVFVNCLLPDFNRIMGLVIIIKTFTDK
jgi:hypothetical protein